VLNFLSRYHTQAKCEEAAACERVPEERKDFILLTETDEGFEVPMGNLKFIVQQNLEGIYNFVARVDLHNFS